MVLGVAPYLQAAPLAFILSIFLVIPIVTIVVVSFWDYDFARIIPSFVLTNYIESLSSFVTWKTYLNTLKFAAIVWALTLVIGFTVAYFLAFHVRTVTMQMVLFLICTVPFLTSNIIRMISWIPFLGSSPNLPSCSRWSTSTSCSWSRPSSTRWCASTAR